MMFCLARPGSHHALLYPTLVAPPEYPEGPVLPPARPPGVEDSPVWCGTLLTPTHYGDGVIASQPLTGQVGETVHPAVVEEQVSVDLHHGLHRALAHDLVHDVLHVPGRPLPDVPPPHSVCWLGAEDWTGD